MANGTKKTNADELTLEETRELKKLETTVRNGIKSYIEVGNALKTIQDKKLYRGKYGSFNRYCLKEWGFTRSTAHDYLHALEVVDSVRTSVQIDLSKAVVLYLLKDVEQRRQIVEMDGFEKMTVRAVLAEVNKLQPRPTPTEDSQLIHLVSAAHKDVSKAVSRIKAVPAESAQYRELITALETALDGLRQLKAGQEQAA
jgi:hypothetical protein